MRDYFLLNCPWDETIGYLQLCVCMCMWALELFIGIMLIGNLVQQ